MKTLKKLNVNAVVHCDWNPRSEAELQPEDPRMKTLIESVDKNGLLQPIGVWDRNGELVCIYGNRRLEAVKLTGISTIDATVYTGIDEATARILTREENENRFGINPISDARLLKDAVSRGMNQAQIAAASGVSEATICRRMKLVMLTDEMTAALEGQNVDTKALEEIAAYPEALQNKAKKKLLERCQWRGYVRSADVREVFNGLTCAIYDGLWVFKGLPNGYGEDRKARCRACALCTGNQPDLFEQSEGESRCMNPKCFKTMEIEAQREIIEAATAGADGYTLVKDSWAEPFHSLKSHKKTKNAPHAWVCWSKWNHTCEVKYGQTPEKYNAQKEAEKAAKDEARRAEESEKQATYANALSAFEKINRFFCCEKMMDDYNAEQGIDIDDFTDETVDESIYAMRERLETFLTKQATIKDDPHALYYCIFWMFSLSANNVTDELDDEGAEILPVNLFDKCPATAIDAFFRLFGRSMLERLTWNRYGSEFIGQFVCDFFAKEIGLTEAEIEAVRKEVSK